MNSSIESIHSENPEAEEKIDFKTYFLKLLSYWWIFAISILFCVSACFIYIRYASPLYMISAKILVEDEKKGGGNFNAGDILGEMGGFLNTKSNVDNEVEILKTRSLAEKVVRALHLNILYFNKGTIKDNQLYKAPFTVELIGTPDSVRPTLFQFIPVNKDAITLRYKDMTGEDVTKKVNYDRPFLIREIGVLQIKRNPSTPFKDKGYQFSITSIDVAATRLQKQLKVAVTNKQVTTIELKIEHAIPTMGEDILNTLIDAYVTQNISEKNKIVESTIDFIDNRLLLVSKELGDIEGSIQNFKQVNELADISEQSKLLVENSSDFAKEAANYETQIDIISALEDYLADEAKNKRVMPNTILPQDLNFSTLVQNYNTLLMERDKLLLASTEESPYIKNLDERIAGQRSAMLKSLNSIKKSAQIGLNQLQKKIILLEGQIRKVPAHERAYLGMFRQQTLKQEIYLFLLKKREETALTKTSNVANSKVIDPPNSDSRPHSPKKDIILLIGLAIGFIIPIIIIYILDLWNNRVQSKDDILKMTSVPIIGEIGISDSAETFIYHNPKSVIAEQFRGLRTNLAFFLNSSTSGQTILLTSSVTGEGKTFTSVNLGTILAISGKKVLLVDLDLRKGSLSDKLGFKGRRGFTNYIIDHETKANEIILPSGFCETLYILPSGPFPPNPAETLMLDRTEELIHSFQKEYDYVILDAPPVGMVTDAQLLNKFASVTLYLIRQNYTLKNYLGISEELNKTQKMKKMGIIFNGIITKGSKYVYGQYDATDSDKHSKTSKWAKISRKFQKIGSV